MFIHVTTFKMKSICFVLHLYVMFMLFHLDNSSDDCYRQNAYTYRGTRNHSASGSPCYDWYPLLNIMHSEEYLADNIWSDEQLVYNYCRDPFNEGFLWCYNEYGDVMECNVSECSRRAIATGVVSENMRPIILNGSYCYHQNAYTYTGTRNHSASGSPCYDWYPLFDILKSSEHHANNIHPGVQLIHNYCRDPFNEGFLWCYNEYGDVMECNISECSRGTIETGVVSENMPPFILNSSSCEGYHRSFTNQQTVTYLGKECLNWSELGLSVDMLDTLHTNDGSTDHNFCRDPADRGYLWCYVAVTDDNLEGEECEVHICDVTFFDWISRQKTFTHPKPVVTTSTSQHTTSKLRTTTAVTTTSTPQIVCFTGSSASYRGDRNLTFSGRVCQKWGRNTPHMHVYSAFSFSPETLSDVRNYCRDPDKSGYVWCYTTDPNMRREKCGIECFNSASLQSVMLFNTLGLVAVSVVYVQAI